jgi:mannose-6-phosphate isomerase-like protein (cupin superfamily)
VFSTAWSYVDHIVLPPGASVGPQNPGNLAEIYYVIGGSGSATVGSETAAVKKDDIMPVNTTQTRTIVNNGSQPLELLVLGIAKDLAAKEAFLAIPRQRSAAQPPRP